MTHNTTTQCAKCGEIDQTGWEWVEARLSAIGHAGFGNEGSDSISEFWHVEGSNVHPEMGDHAFYPASLFDLREVAEEVGECDVHSITLKEGLEIDVRQRWTENLHAYWVPLSKCQECGEISAADWDRYYGALEEEVRQIEDYLLDGEWEYLSTEDREAVDALEGIDLVRDLVDGSDWVREWRDPAEAIEAMREWLKEGIEAEWADLQPIWDDPAECPNADVVDDWDPTIITDLVQGHYRRSEITSGALVAFLEDNEFIRHKDAQEVPPYQ